ncbi:hypothetical protein [Nostoc sp. DedSLP04]|nr:hypothetical protein [Nostoc sp. DedSLP04]MDZ8032788.1 hypothetical protein [Nostoc sp. DedSLP04]
MPLPTYLYHNSRTHLELLTVRCSNLIRLTHDRSDRPPIQCYPQEY